MSLAIYWAFTNFEKNSSGETFMYPYLFTSESVTCGHPDKIADQISDAVVDACLAVDPQSKVACETVVGNGFVLLSGEITTKATLDYAAIVKDTIKEIGYTESSYGMDYKSMGVLISINKQSSDIALGVNEGEGLYKEMGAGDQGMMFGYASNETPELMPLPISLCHALTRRLKELRETNSLTYLRPDGKVQITVEYEKPLVPKRIHSVVISTQHADSVDLSLIEQDMRAVAMQVIPLSLIDEQTTFYINPTGRFVIGGPASDTGLTGRKIIVDTYGGMARHGGGCFSGKDPTKVDRSAAYAARYIAKNIVAAELAEECEVQLAYAIGVPFPLSIKVDTFGTSKIPGPQLSQAVSKVFSLTPKGIIEMLDLRRPIYKKTASGGHFGRAEPEFTWERCDRTSELLAAIPKAASSYLV